MTLLEYVTNLTGNGTRIEMPRLLGFIQTERSGDQRCGTVKVTYAHERSQFEDELYSEKERLKKAKERLESITLTAINVTNSEQFYRKCFAYCPVNVRNGAYRPDKEKWDTLLNDIVLEASNRLLKVAYAERNMNGAKTMLSILQARMDAWQRKATATIEKNTSEDGKSEQVQVVFNIK